jgi:hypothetical protein
MSHPALKAVTSSAIAAYRHKVDAMGVGCLVVEFISGKLYHYAVPVDELQKLDSASSKGTFINQLKNTHKGTELNTNEVTELFVFEDRTVADVTSLFREKKKKERNSLISYETAMARYPDFANFF